MEDIDYGTLFGIDEGGNEQEVAEPAEVETEEVQGEEEQEVAEPAETDEESEDEQPPEERSRYAAARRKAEAELEKVIAERDAEIEKARQEEREKAQRRIDEKFNQSGLTNPYTKKRVTSEADYDEYLSQKEADIRSRTIRKSGMTDQEFQDFLAKQPEVKEVNDSAKERERVADERIKQANELIFKAKMEEELKEISSLDPNIKEIEDIKKMETYPQFREYVQKGNNFVEAFKLANFDTLNRNTAAASRQAAINNAKSKAHLSATTTRGAGAAPVPADVREMYLAFNPGATDAEIQAHYNKHHKKE